MAIEFTETIESELWKILHIRRIDMIVLYYKAV